MCLECSQMLLMGPYNSQYNRSNEIWTSGLATGFYCIKAAKIGCYNQVYLSERAVTKGL